MAAVRARERIPVEPAVLDWARRSAGLGVANAAKKIGVSPATLEKWEAGELDPTRQLRNVVAPAPSTPGACDIVGQGPQCARMGWWTARSSRSEPATDWSPT